MEINSPLKFLYELIKPYKYWCLLALVGPVFGSLHHLGLNYAIKLLIDEFSKNDVLKFIDLLYPISLFIGFEIFHSVCWRLASISEIKGKPYFFRDLMVKIYDHVSNHSYTYFQNNLSGSIISKIKGINDSVYSMYNALQYSLSEPFIKLTISGIVLGFINIYLFLFILFFATIYTPIAFYCYKKLENLTQDAQNDWHKIVGLVADKISNIFTILSFAKNKAEGEQIMNHYNNKHIPLVLKRTIYDFKISILMDVFYWILMISVFLLTINLRNAGKISTGGVAFTMAITFNFAQNLWHTAMGTKDFFNHLGNFKSSFSIIRTSNNIDENEGNDIQIQNPSIEFKNVNFCYSDDKNIFENLNISIKSGEKIGLVGISGSGKSTIISLLTKNFKINSGEILIDNQGIWSKSTYSIRKNIALIPQDISLFHRTILENISYAKQNASLEEVYNAAKFAKIHDFIETLSKKYNTIVGERGVKLSGGQRQRIAIARAILKNAPILILDEATSSLDTESERDVQISLNAMLENKNTTVIAIAHRLSTLKHLDRIIVLEKGKIIEEGSHDALINKKDGMYKKLWDMQMI